MFQLASVSGCYVSLPSDVQYAFSQAILALVDHQYEMFTKVSPGFVRVLVSFPHVSFLSFNNFPFLSYQVVCHGWSVRCLWLGLFTENSAGLSSLRMLLGSSEHIQKSSYNFVNIW